MSGTINQPANEILNNLNRQSCVRTIRQSNLPVILKAEAEKFMQRNALADCGRVPPNCLKAFMVNTAKRMGLIRIIPYVMSLFRAKIGYDGYYLDNGKLFRVDLSNNCGEFAQVS